MDKPLRGQKLFFARTLILVSGMLLLTLGLWRDETSFVLRRAIIICLGCIGIG